MTAGDITTAIAIHLLVPLAGLIFYLLIARKIYISQIIKAPYLDLFVAFAVYGGLSLVVLTILFWEWSAMASLGLFFLFFAAPFIMAIIAYRNYKNRKISKYHLRTSVLAISYFIVAPLMFLVLQIIIKSRG